MKRLLATATLGGTLAAALITGSAQGAVTATSLQPASFSNQVVTGRYSYIPDEKILEDGSKTPWPTTLAVDTGTFRVSNTGSSAVELTQLAPSNTTAFTVIAPTSLPVTIPGGASVDVTVKFVQPEPSNKPKNLLVASDLKITTDDPSTPQLSVKLRGFWQRMPEHNTEPNLRQIVNGMFGYGSVVPSDTELVAGLGSANKPSSDEVYSPYWKRFDSTKPVRVIQLVAFHGTGATESFRWAPYTQSNVSTKPGFTTVAQHDPDYAQAFLPPKRNNGGPYTDVNFTPSSEAFGFVVGGEWSDPNLNLTAYDETRGCTSACGQHVRIWTAKDGSGAVLPGEYLLSMDYGNSSYTNFDFQDNVYLVKNIKPANAYPAPDVPLDSTAPGPALYRVTTGATRPFVDDLGRTWTNDTALPSGASYSPSNMPAEGSDLGVIEGTKNDGLFGSYRGNTGGTNTAMTYHLPTGAATNVAVRLYFAERFWAAPNKRVFSVSAEGSVIEPNVDIYARAGGRNVAYTLVKTNINVADGALDLSLKASVNLPALSGIEVFDTSADPGAGGGGGPTPIPSVTPTPAPIVTPGPGGSPLPTVEPTPTPKPATPTPTPSPTPKPGSATPTPAPGSDAPTPAPGAATPTPPVVFGEPTTPVVPTPSVKVTLRFMPDRTIRVVCHRTDTVNNQCRVELKTRANGKGASLAVKRLKFVGESAKVSIKLGKVNWTRVQTLGARAYASLIAPDGRTKLAADEKALAGKR